MDDDLQQLEAELSRLRPAAPTREMLARLETHLAPPARRAAPMWWLWAGALPLAAAAALAIAFILNTRSTRGQSITPANANAIATQRPTIPAQFQPVAAENVLYAARDEGLITLDDGTPARRERLNYVDTITWKNPRTNASVRWSVPREEVRVVPVIFQ